MRQLLPEPPMQDELYGGKYACLCDAVRGFVDEFGQLRCVQHGFGRYQWPSGSYYEGQMQNGKFCGRGKKVYSDGTVEEGMFENDEYVGPAPGQSYSQPSYGAPSGGFNNYGNQANNAFGGGFGQPSYGQPSYGAPTGGLVHKTINYTNGATYVGETLNGKRHGQGTMARRPRRSIARCASRRSTASSRSAISASSGSPENGNESTIRLVPHTFSSTVE